MPKGLRPITTYNVFATPTYDTGAAVVAKNTTVTSEPIDLREVAQDGIFSLEYTITQDGTLTIAYTVCSTKSGTYFTPTGAVAIATGLTKTPGHGGLTFNPEMYPFMKITLTETKNSGSDYIIATIRLNIQ
jgi:hypothetical protein